MNADGTASETLRSLPPAQKGEAVYFLGFEVLDNLPHDKVVVRDRELLQAVVGRRDGAGVLGVGVSEGPECGFVEELEPLSDPSILACLLASGTSSVCVL